MKRVGGWARRLLGPQVFDELAVVHRAYAGQPGVLLDVGAHVGESLRPFADDGWVIYAIEPDAINRRALLENLAPHWRVIVDGRAISEVDGVTVDLFTSPVSSGITTLTPFHHTHRATSRVETVRLDTLLAGIANVTIVKTDTEGYDLPVLRTFPWDRLRPWAVVAEFEDRKTVPLGYTYESLAKFLSSMGYAVIVSEWFPIVEYGRRHAWRSIRRYPAPLSSPDAWGNLIAVHPADASKVLREARRTGARLRLRSTIEHLRAAVQAIRSRGEG